MTVDAAIVPALRADPAFAALRRSLEDLRRSEETLRRLTRRQAEIREEERRRLGLDLNPMETSYYLSRRALRVATKSRMPLWQDRIFIWLARHTNDASQYFRIPTDRAIEVGTQIAI